MKAGEREHGPGFWVAYVVGGAVMAWGGLLLVRSTSTGGERFGFALWIVLADVLVDWLVLPVVALAGWLVARFVPPRALAPVQVGLLLTATVLVVAWLPLRGTAAGTGNPTIQPLDYPTAVTVTVAAIWAAMGVWVALRRRARP